MRIYLLLAIAVGASMVGANCGGTGVGDPCTPEDEYLTGFSGFSQSEVNVESRSFQCETRVCLVNHFQGRVSCPYGQVEDPMAEDSGYATCMGTIDNRNSIACQPGGSLHATSCQVPDRDGSAWEDRIIPPVPPQLVDRQAVDSVYCSCRCAAPEGVDDESAEFCECPSGFVCEPLVENLGLGRGNLAGSYCVKEGTSYDPGDEANIPCESSLRNCNDDYTVEYESRTIGTNQKRACLPSGATCREGDSCCTPVPAEQGCVTEEGNPDRNCYGTCTTTAYYQNGEVVTQIPACQHVNQDGQPIQGAIEALFTIERDECEAGDTCP